LTTKQPRCKMPSMATERTMRLSDELRRAIKTADISRYEICKRTGLDKGQLSRFVHGRTGLSLDSIDLVADCLGLGLRQVRKPHAKRG